MHTVPFYIDKIFNKILSILYINARRLIRIERAVMEITRGALE
jgi:hypothetical protein